MKIHWHWCAVWDCRRLFVDSASDSGKLTIYTLPLKKKNLLSDVIFLYQCNQQTIESAIFNSF